MDCDSPTAAETALASGLSGPKSVSTDGVTVDQHPIPDLIAADRYSKAVCAARSPRRGLRFTKLIPPGSV